MAGFTPATFGAIRGAVCQALSLPEPQRQWVINAYALGAGQGFYTPAGQDFLDFVQNVGCSADSQQIPGAGVVSFPNGPAFTGGQCVGSRYIVDFTYTNGVGQTITGPIDSLFGPIGNLFLEEQQNGNFTVRIPCRGIEGGQLEPDGFSLAIGTNQPGPITNFQTISATPKGGDPDNCGNPPGGSSVPTVTGPPYDYDDDTGSPVTVNPTFNFRSPIFDLDGTLNLPIEITSPSFTANANFNLSTGDITFNLGGVPGQSNCCPQPEDGPDTDEETPDDPPPPVDDKRFFAVEIRAIFDDANVKATKVVDGDTPLYVPRLGTVSFGYEVGGRRAWSTDFPIKKRKQMVFCEQPAVGYTWFTTKEGDITYEVTPLLIRNEAPNLILADS